MQKSPTECRVGGRTGRECFECCATEKLNENRRKRGRPKRRWLDKVKDDIKEKGLSADEVYDHTTWRRMSSYINPA